MIKLKSIITQSLIILFMLFSNILIFGIITLGFIIIVPINIVRHMIMHYDISMYLYNLLKGLDQLGGSMIYDTEDYTISSWTYYLHSKGNKLATYFMKFIDFLAVSISYILFKLDVITYDIYEWNKKHCENSYHDETEALLKKANKHLHSED